MSIAPSTSQQLADDAAVQHAIAAINSRRGVVAEDILRDVLRRQPQHRRALHLLGVALLTQERAHDAIPPLQQALQSEFDPIIAAHLGKALRHAGRPAEALTVLERAAAHTPPHAGSCHELGVLLCSLRRFDDAETAFLRGLKLEPRNVEMIIELGGAYVARADAANAKLMFARALAQVPGHARALQGFGTALMFEGEFERAADRFRQVLARDPSHERAQLDLGHCLLELGHWDEAIACLRDLNRRAPHLYGPILKTLVSSGRGRFWLRPTAAARFINLSPPGRGPVAP
jgi:Flp pilus assembly protein TadD